MSRKERGCAKSIAAFTSKRRFAFWTGSLFVHESDRAGIEAVISADHLELAGINSWFENGVDERNACVTFFTFASTVASRSSLSVASTAGLNGRDERLNVGRRFGFDGAATLMPEHHDETHG
jgi:hypothetical protein